MYYACRVFVSRALQSTRERRREDGTGLVLCLVYLCLEYYRVYEREGRDRCCIVPSISSCLELCRVLERGGGRDRCSYRVYYYYVYVSRNAVS